jgi:1,4-dihydroxy-2-naphthoate octaprenyltransferase
MNRLSKFIRLTRVQFTPLIITPVLIGTAAAWGFDRMFNPVYLLLAVVGSVFLHLASNTIDDVFDYRAGVDQMSDQLFPPDFPGWKAIPRGVVTLGRARIYSYLMFGAAASIGLYFTIAVGYWVLALLATGVFLGYFYTAPPLRLDFRGVGLGELSIFATFGVIPALGAYYVQTATLSPIAAYVAIPSGILTATVLMCHDQIFFEPYVKTGKRTLTIVLGRGRALTATLLFSIVAYLSVVFGVFSSLLPPTSLAVCFTIPLTLRQLRILLKHEKTPPDYAALTQATFMADIAFGVLFAAGLLL